MSSARTDVVVGVGFAALAFTALTTSDGFARPAGTVVFVATVGICACLVWQRRAVLTATLVAAAWVAVISIADREGRYDTIENVGLLVIFLLCYRLGAHAAARPGLCCLVPLIAALQLGSSFNPFLAMITVGPWVTGQLVRSRDALRAELLVRSEELERERSRYVAEAVRFERVRIARELHDVVAHCVSVVVIQAHAAQRFGSDHPARVRAAFDDIAQMCQQAEADLDRLARLVAPTTNDTADPVADLVTRARAAGTVIDYRTTGGVAALPAQLRSVAYRVVQETLTNARKHAAGAVVTLTVDCDDGVVDIAVINAGGSPSPVADDGGRHGLPGVRERIAQYGGRLSAGPTADGGWSVRVRLPADSLANPS